MRGKRQKNQMYLAFAVESRSEAPTAAAEGSEPRRAERPTESPVNAATLMEEVCGRANLLEAYQQVKSNKGSPGVDGMTVAALWDYLKEHWPRIREQLLAGTYRPQPVKRVEIPKPDGGGRKLGIPTALDRFIQQAVMQVLQKQWDPTFSEYSFGFRPRRSAHQAVQAAQEYVTAGRRWVVDLDLEKFFDRVNHDVLMGRIARQVEDKRVLKLIRAFLNAGVLENGLVSPTDEGTPQGGPLSPLLSNLLLDELDRELERRGLRFVRYTADCNIYVASRRAGERVKASVTQFLAKKLRLKVNESKSAVPRPWERKFLGITFTSQRQPKRRIAPQALKRFAARIREITRRTRGVKAEKVLEDLNSYLRGWGGYFGHCQTPSVLSALNGWLRRRLRSFYWKQWKTGRVRFRELRARGVGHDLAAQTAGSAHGPWRLAKSPAPSLALPDQWLARLGLPTLRVTVAT
jgi:RNA-directed DNA polymerase